MSILSSGLDGPEELNDTARDLQRHGRVNGCSIFLGVPLEPHQWSLSVKFEEVTLRMDASEIPSFSQIAYIAPARNAQ